MTFLTGDESPQEAMKIILGNMASLADTMRDDDGWREALQVESEIYCNELSDYAKDKSGAPVAQHWEQWAIVHSHDDGLPRLEKNT